MADSEKSKNGGTSVKVCDAQNRSERKLGVSDLVAVAAIAAGWAGLVAVTNPIAEVILNDDGAYAYSVNSILQTGTFKLSVWQSANVIAQAYWGALFCLPFGFSYTALRLSTLTIALAGLLALYGLQREAGVDSAMALFGVLTLALNPLFYELSFTFMTDVPFLGFTMVAMYLLVRGIKQRSKIELALGLLAATIALLTRQTGLALFFALSLTYLVKNGLGIRNTIRAAVPALLGLGIQFSYQTWLKKTGRITETFGNTAAAVLNVGSMQLSHGAKLVVSGVILALLYLGLFLLPLLIFIGYRHLRDVCRQQRWIAISTSGIFIAAGSVPLLRHHQMPFLPNVLYDLGLGPVMVKWIAPYSLPSVGPKFWIAVTIVGIFAGALVLQVLVSAVLRLVRTRGQNQEVLLLLFATGFIYFGPLPFLQYYDRYLLLLIPLSTIVLFMVCGQPDALSLRWTTPAILCLLIYGAFAIAGTHDYLSWNRPRWQALRTLTAARHVPPYQIDGGFEFYSFYLTPKSFAKFPEESPVGDDFKISFSPLAGYTELDRFTYRLWLPPSVGTILVLQKQSSSEAQKTGGAYRAVETLTAPPMP